MPCRVDQFLFGFFFILFLSFPWQRESSMLIMRNYYVYILANKRNGTLYIGVTNNLERRVYQHKQNLIQGFTKKYNVHHLVYYEATSDINAALQREKQLKKWDRKWKLELIEKNNPDWKDLMTGFPLARE